MSGAKLADDADDDRPRRPSPPIELAPRVRARTRAASSAGSRQLDAARRTPAPTSSAMPFASKKSTAPALPLQCSDARAGQHPARRASLAVGRKTAPSFEQPDVVRLAAPVVDERVEQARQERRPQHGELLGQRVGDRDRRRRRARRTAAAAARSMNVNVHGLLQAGAAQDAAQAAVASRRRATAAAAPSRSGGNVAGIRSKPQCRPTSSMRSASRATSTRNAGTSTCQPSPVGVSAKPEARQDPRRRRASGHRVAEQPARCARAAAATRRGSAGRG